LQDADSQREVERANKSKARCFVVDESLMCVSNFQESKETPNSSPRQNNAEGLQCLLRRLIRIDCHSESPGGKDHENIKHAQCVFPLLLEILGSRQG
jgi:hypothetical protein